MKNLKITVNVNDKEKVDFGTVKSVNLMWIKVKEAFRQWPDAQIIVEEDGKPFKDLKQVKKASGKLWMINSVKETCRKYIPKTQKKEEPTEEKPVKMEAVETPIETSEPSLDDVDDLLKNV